MRFVFLLLFTMLVLTPLRPSHAQDAAATSHAAHEGHVFRIIAIDYAFQAVDEIPSGWTTIEFTNQGEEPHMLLFHRLPEGRNFDEYAADVWRPINEAWMTLLDEGRGRLQISGIPEWFNAAEQWMGGAGILGPGLSMEITVNLEPGTYAMECYVKSVDGEFHAMEGMIRELVVTDSRSEMTPPDADIEITLTNDGMAIEGDLTPGRHLVKVDLAEGRSNVHVARLEPEADVQDVVDWIHWSEMGGLWPPAPASFIGGLHLLPANGTGYFTLDLEPGRYLFLSEMTARQGVLKEIIVEP